MASTQVHVPQPFSTYRQRPSSPTLTNPDMILPLGEQQENFSTLSVRPSSGTAQSDIVSNSSLDGIPPSARPRSDSDAEVGIATAVALPMLVRGRVATTAPATSNLPTYHGYEHGAPLSDIGEELEETIRSRGTTPNHSRNSSKQAPPLRHKKRLSNMSSSSSGSEKGDQWERFDTSQLISDRVAADIAQARDAADENDEPASRRNSRDVEEELALLNDRAEKILENARKRLSSMEDNLSKARHSILVSPRSIPNMHELGQHQPAGGLYRSISQNAHNRRSRGLFPPLKVMGGHHTRTGSDMAPVSGLKRLSGIAEPRSASAMDFSPARYGVGFITTDAKPSPPSSKLMAHSPSSSRSFNSPLRILAEESDHNTPSTVKTSPDGTTPVSTTFAQPRGLGIHASGTKTQEDLTRMPLEHSESPTSLHRSSSQASSRSARDLKDQMSEMKSRIADLRSKAQADSLRRRSMQSLRTPSPFLSSTANGHASEGGFAGAMPSHQQELSTTPTGQPSSNWRTPSTHAHERKDSVLDGTIHPDPITDIAIDEPSSPEPEQTYPITPVAARLRNVTDLTPIHPSSARTDRNTPNLVTRLVDNYRHVSNGVEEAVPAHENEEIGQDYIASSEEEDQIAASEEEQIYLNEVLEESLHDIEPGIPSIPGEYMVGADSLEIEAEETERHEDRLDAFDYENMFLHSAMGTYRGDQSDGESDDESLITSREDVTTPTGTYEDIDDQDGEETVSGEDQSTGDEGGPVIVQQTGLTASPTSMRKVTPPSPVMYSSTSPSSHRRSPLRETVNGRLRSPPQPWTGVARTKSMETVSSIASYQTATEGDGEYDDEDEDFHDEILNWGNAPPSHTNGTLPYLPAHGVSAKAQNVLGWPAPPAAPGASRHSSYVRSQPVTGANGHFRTGSGGSARGVHGRSPLSNVQYNTYPFPGAPPPTQPLPPPPAPVENQATVTHQANTEILMESLIKLADPDFSIESTGRSNFADIDKELVLGLLRAVGEVCDGVLRAQNGRRGNVVKELRSRLINAKEVLVGVSEQEGLEEILEGDEDAE